MPLRIRDHDGLRLLDFGTPWCQGAMRLDDADALELAYAVRMFGWLLFHDMDTLARQHLVTLGLGAGSLTKFAWRVLGMQATAVEIDHEVIEACHAHFDLPREGDGLRLVHADARAYVTASDQVADVIQVDAYDAAVERPALDDEPFYAACRTCLREGGTLAVNLVGAAMDARASVARLRAGLQPRAVWQFPPTPAGNVVVLAHRGDVPPEDVLAARAEAIEDLWDLPAAQWLAMARRT